MKKTKAKEIAKTKIKALVMFSGGLDSRLVVKILQEQGIDLICVMFKLPFGGGCCNNELCSFKYSQIQGVELKIIDCTSGGMFDKYLNVIKKAEHGTGAGCNPCIDCKIFMFKHAKTLLKELGCDFIATGEVLGQRPMSQTSYSLKIIDEKVGVIRRPLIELGLSGRSRKPQMALAKKYKITYPLPAGGCLLCEKDYSAKLKDLFAHEKTIKPEHIESLWGFRHFRTKNHGKIILGRDHKENLRLEKTNKKLKYNFIIPKEPGPTAIYENKDDEKLSKELIDAYSKGNEKKRKDFEKIRIGV